MALRYRWVASSLAAGFILCGPAWAQQAQQQVEQALVEEQKAMDQEPAPATAEGQKRHMEMLTQQYGVNAGTVQRMRDQRQGWGEISTQLALAQQLSRNEPEKYPTTTDALGRVEQLRGEGKGYGVIAKELGFKLGPVVSSVKTSRGTLQAASRVDRPGSQGEVERPARPERPERPERTSRPDRPGRSGRPE